jgi:sec-independent protein translocase protein TatB
MDGTRSTRNLDFVFSSVGWGEIAILMIAALVILGPERLPGAVSWTMGAVRKAREYAEGAKSQIKDDLGTDIDDLRKPLAQLNELRGMTPRAVITKHLLDGDDSVFNLKPFDSPKPVSTPLPSASPPQVSLKKDTAGTDR